MKTSLLIAAVGMLVLGSGTALAQGAPPGAGAAPAPGTGDSSAIAKTNRDQMSGYNSVISNMDRNKPAAQPAKPKARPATAAEITAGAALHDSAGVEIGKIEKIEADGAVVLSGDTRVKLPLNSFGVGGAGLMVGITADKFREVVTQAKAQAQASAPPEQKGPVAATAADIKAGNVLRDVKGVEIGTIAKVDADGAVVLTEGKRVKLPFDSFGKDDAGLVLGITADEFKAVIAKSTASKPGS